MRILLVSIFLISIIFFISIPDAFGGTYLVNVPMGAAGGVGNFEPNVITIEKGDTVKWSIFDRGKHSVTSDSGLFDNSPMEANRAGSTCFSNCKPFTYTFHNDGTYDYHCKFHSWMQGSVIVGGIGSTASVKDCSNVGCVYLDKQRYGVSEGRTVLVKIYGKVNDSKNTDFVFMDIKEPSGKMAVHKIPVTSTGKFEYPLPISYDKRGMYDVIVRTEHNPSGNQVGSIWFEVVKTSAVSQPKDITPTSIILTTDSQSYIKGSTVGIAGQLIPYQKIYGSFEVTIKVNSPNGNVVNVAQTQPSSTGTFGSTVNTSSWSTFGNYEIRAKYENLIKSTSFAFTIPSSSTSKTSTFLKLDSLDNPFKAQGPNSRGEVDVSGQLLTIDRQSGISGAEIKLVFTGFTYDGKDHYKITTGNNGKFDWDWKWGVGNNYGVYAVYDGSSNFKSSKSQTEYFTVKSQSIQPQPSTRESSSGGSEFILILIIAGGACAGVVVVLLNKNKAKPPMQESWLRPVDHSPTSTPKPASQKPSITLFCTKCGTPIRLTEKFCTKCGKPRPK